MGVAARGLLMDALEANDHDYHTATKHWKHIKVAMIILAVMYTTITRILLELT